MTDTPRSDTSTLWQEHHIHDRVIVPQAEDDFDRVQQSLRTPKAVEKGVSHGAVDLEKGRDEETFDLREYLTSSNDASSSAGIKHKHVGVTWEDLKVLGIGGEENKVRHSVKRHPRLLSHDFVFTRSTSLHTQVRDFALSFAASFS